MHPLPNTIDIFCHTSSYIIPVHHYHGYYVNMRINLYSSCHISHRTALDITNIELDSTLRRIFLEKFSIHNYLIYG